MNLECQPMWHPGDDGVAAGRDFIVIGLLQDLVKFPGEEKIPCRSGDGGIATASLCATCHVLGLKRSDDNSCHTMML